MLYFISSDSRRNKNNINICESNVLSLKDKVNLLEKKINEMTNLQQPNLEGMLNQLQDPKFMNSNDLMFPLGGIDNEEEDDETEDDETQDDSETQNDDEDDEDYEDDEDDEDEDEDDEDDEDDDDEDDDDEDDDDEDDDDEDNDDDSQNNNEEEIISKILEESEKINEKIEELEETNIENKVDELKEEIKEVKQELIEDNDKEKELMNYMEKVSPSMLKTEKSSVKKYPKISLSKLEEGHIETGIDGNEYVVALNKLKRKFWKKVNIEKK